MAVIEPRVYEVDSARRDEFIEVCRQLQALGEGTARTGFRLWHLPIAGLASGRLMIVTEVADLAGLADLAASMRQHRPLPIDRFIASGGAKLVDAFLAVEVEL